MSIPIKKTDDLNQPPNTLARRTPPLPGGPVMLRANKSPAAPLKLVDTSADTNTPSSKNKTRSKDTAVIRGLRDLQELQKQTVAVLEAVRSNLDDIQQVLRSPEATRGMEKQQNAATLLSKGFARDAVIQATGAVELLPANPDSHLLLSLSLAANQQFDESLETARKGLALFDRRQHPLAIEAGLLHALAAMGHGAEAAERWAQIIDALPVPVLLEHLARMAVCYPADAPEGALDAHVERRLTLAENAPPSPASSRLNETAIPAPMLFAGLDAAQQHALPRTHRALLALATRQLTLVNDPTDIIRFITEYIIPLSNRNLDRSTNSLAKAAARKLLALHADAMLLHRAMVKLQMAGASRTVTKIAELLAHWRAASKQQATAKRSLRLSLFLLLSGLAALAYVLWGQGALYGKIPMLHFQRFSLPAIWIGPAIMGLGSILGILGLFRQYPTVELPHNRKPLTLHERTYLQSAEVKQSLRAALTNH